MSYPVTELQLAILDALWSRGEASAIEIHDDLRPERDVTQATVNTLLARLSDRGLVAHREEGRRYQYRAAVERHTLRRSLIEEFLEHTRPLFQGDFGLLASHMYAAGREGVEPRDFDEIKALLAELEDRSAQGSSDPGHE